MTTPTHKIYAFYNMYNLNLNFFEFYDYQFKLFSYLHLALEC